jgi:hypothetical protein
MLFIIDDILRRGFSEETTNPISEIVLNQVALYIPVYEYWTTSDMHHIQFSQSSDKYLANLFPYLSFQIFENHGLDKFLQYLFFDKKKSA